MNPEDRRLEQLEQSQQRQDAEIQELVKISSRLVTLAENQEKNQEKLSAQIDTIAKDYQALNSTVTAFIEIRRQINDIENDVRDIKLGEAESHKELDLYKKEVEASLNEVRKPIWGAIYIIGFVELIGILVGIWVAFQ